MKRKEDKQVKASRFSRELTTEYMTLIGGGAGCGSPSLRSGCGSPSLRGGCGSPSIF
jgi:hypothetical protein